MLCSQKKGDKCSYFRLQVFITKYWISIKYILSMFLKSELHEISKAINTHCIDAGTFIAAIAIRFPIAFKSENNHNNWKIDNLRRTKKKRSYTSMYETDIKMKQKG